MGKIVKLNNFLPPEIQEDVMKEQPLLMHHTHLQKAFDENVKPGDYVELEGTFNIDKLVGYKPEWYGTDNRPVTNATHLTMHGSQPCFSIELNNNVINFSGATFIVHRMFNDGLGIRGFKGQNQIHLGNWYTRRILDVDPNGLAATDRSVLYSNPAKRWIPPIDGTSGSSIKGTKEAGFNVTVNNFELSKFRSNSLDTSKMTDELAGYNPTYGKHYGGGNYPQDDGTTAPTWGTWEKGWFGNFHAAIFINQNHTYTQRERDMAKLVITGGYIRGFAYAGIEVGSIPLPICGAVPPNTWPGVEAYAVKNLTIRDVTIEDVYESGIQRTRFDNLIIRDCIIRRSGAPDWSLTNHSKPNSPGSSQVDPGYGISSGRVNMQGRLIIDGCTMIDCNRKGIDAHHGTSHIFTNNFIRAGYWGIQVALEEPQVDKLSPEWEHDICKYVISNNEIHAGYKGIDFANGSFGPVVRADANLWYMKLSVKVTNNTVHAPTGWYYNYAHDGFYIDGNTFIFSLPYGEFRAGGNEAMKSNAFFHGTQDIVERGIGIGDVITNNRVYNSVYGNFTSGFTVQTCNGVRFCNNTVDRTPYRKRVTENIQEPFVSSKDFVFRDGYATMTPFFLGNHVNLICRDNTYYNRLDLNTASNYAVFEAPAALNSEVTAEKTVLDNIAISNTLIKIVPMTKSGITDRVSTDPDVFYANYENIRTEGANPPRGFRTVISNKNPLTVSTYNGADRGNLSANNSATGVYADIEFPVRNDVTTDGVEFKCRINALGKNGVGTLISSGENTFISVVYRSDPKIYVLVSSMKINVNGAEYLPKTDVPITLKSVEYHIKFNTPVIKGRNRIRLGAPYNGNNQLTGDFWEINIHRGKDIMTVSEDKEGD